MLVTSSAQTVLLHGIYWCTLQLHTLRRCKETAPTPRLCHLFKHLPRNRVDRQEVPCTSWHHLQLPRRRCMSGCHFSPRCGRSTLAATAGHTKHQARMSVQPNKIWLSTLTGVSSSQAAATVDSLSCHQVYPSICMKFA